MPIKSLLAKEPEIKSMLTKTGEWELYSVHLYLYMANLAQKLGLPGSQKYFLKEVPEEVGHYQKVSDFVNDRGDMLPMVAIEAIKEDAKGLMDILKILYETMILITDHYEKFYELAQEKKCYVAIPFVNEFLVLQTKAIGLYGDLITQLETNDKDILEMDEYIGEL